MPIPRPEARTLLDDAAQRLALVALEKNLKLSIGDFEPESVIQAERVQRDIRRWLVRWTFMLVCVLISVLAIGLFFVATSDSDPTNAGNVTEIANPLVRPFYTLLLSSLWFTAMGGLGAVTNLFSIYLQLRPTEGLNENDTFVINARIILGCIGSFVVSLTVLAPYASQFFMELAAFKSVTGGWRLLIPFIIGFAFPFALAFLQRLIRTFEFFLGIDISGDRSERNITRQRR